MAYANNIGLNEILEIGIPLSRGKQIENTSIHDSMESKQSKIPKFSFSIRKTNGEKKPSPGSSPSVSRSKSMKVQRTTAPLVQRKTKHSNSIDNDTELDETPTTSFLSSPSNQKREIIKSQPSSRSTTPVTDYSTGNFTRSMTVSSSSRNNSASNLPHFGSRGKTHARSSSFSSREKHSINPSSLKKPSGVSETSDHHNSRTKVTGSSPLESSQQQIRRTSSGPKPSHDESDGSYEGPSKQTSCVGRTPDSRKLSVGSQNGGRRPSSMISFTEKSSDLNELASEITQMGDTQVFGSAPPRIPASRTHMVSNRQVQTKGMISESTKGGISRLRPPIARNTSNDGSNRPSSVTANYHRNETRNVCRPKSAADMHKLNQSQQTNRSSTPSNEQNTPSPTTPKNLVVQDENRINQTTSVSITTPRRPIGAAQNKMGRTPFFRSAKSNIPSDKNVVRLEDDAVGLNELEGAVLLDAEDYRRMLQEVKTLKSVLLRLKRELAADGGVTVPSPTSVSTKSSVKGENSPDRNSELCKQIEKLSLEKNKLKTELETSLKKQKITENKVEKLQTDLTESKTESDDLKEKLHFLESHRESLLDKVERLHADKHNLEDRLNALEKSAKYESTILSEDWMEGELYDESIDNGFNYDDEDATY